MFYRKIFSFALVALLLLATAFLGYNCWLGQKEIAALRVESAAFHRQDQSLKFLQLFIKKVLKANTEVSFETRLQLESDIRQLNDDKIFAQWQSFVNSKTETEAQNNVKDLLDLLVDKAVTGK